MSLPRLISNYLKYFKLDISDVILCECGCGRVGHDFHHLQPRSSFGSKRKVEQDRVENVACIAIECHSEAHKSKAFNDHLKLQHRKLLLKFSNNEDDRIIFPSQGL